MQSSNVFQAYDTFNQDVIVQVSQNYLHNLNLTIKHLTKLLKVRLRTEFPDSFSILNELNQKVVPLTQCSQDILSIYAKLQQRYAQQTQQSGLEKRLTELENNYSSQIKQLTEENNELQTNIESVKSKVLILQNLLLDSQELCKKMKQKQDQLQDQINLKEAEVNKLNLEKSTLKSQSSQLSLLLKQVNQEKSTSDVDNKIIAIKDELERVKAEYARHNNEKDLHIQNLEREIQLARQEISLNNEFKEFSQSIKNTPSDQKQNSSTKRGKSKQ